MDIRESQRLNDLGELVKKTQQRMHNYDNAEINLSPAFRQAFAANLEAGGNKVKFEGNTAIIQTSGELQIYAPNQWFVIASFAIELVEEIIRYRNLTEGMLDSYSAAFGGKEKKEIYKQLKSGDGSLVNTFRQYMNEYLNLSCDDTSVCRDNCELLCRFVSDSAWWLGGKGIERTSDYYVSPVLGSLSLVNASQSYIASITYMYVNDQRLKAEIGTMVSAEEVSLERNGSENEQQIAEDNKLRTCLDIELEPRKVKIHPMNCIVYGAPGTGKTYSTAEYALAIIEGRPVDRSRKSTAERKAVMKKYNEYVKKDQVVFTTFHQNYGYEEFIQGLRPDTKSERMTFKIVDGVFKRIADQALNDAENNYVIIIDEINRANISKVFGELITLIEDDKRWGEVNETCATLQSGDVFAVPNNLYILGTMNSADKSISLIDAALRRRFSFIEQRPEAELIEDSFLQSVLKKLNEILADELESSDLLIGHSYFMNKSAGDLDAVLNNSIIPLLYEYFYDNKKKAASVLKEALAGTDVEIVDDKIGRLRVKKDEG